MAENEQNPDVTPGITLKTAVDQEGGKDGRPSGRRTKEGKPAKSAQKLTLLQQKFCAEYVKDMNGTQAAIRAGYNPHTARRQASRLLTLDHIQDALADFRRELAADLKITPERVLAEWAIIAFANMGDYVTINEDGDPVIDLSKCTREQLAALAETEVQDFVDARATSADGDGKRKRGRDVRRVKIKLHSKTVSLDALSKHLGLFKEDNEQKVQPTSSEPTEAEWEAFWAKHQAVENAPVTG